jgi:hypothetical protein
MIGASWASVLTANGLVKNVAKVHCVHDVSIRDVESLSFSIFYYLVLKSRVFWKCGLLLSCTERGIV